jgi:PEP-CTERM motif
MAIQSRSSIVALVMLAASLGVEATPISVHDTGVNVSDGLVATGSIASFWALTAEPAGATETIGSNPCRFRHPSYFADSSTAAWVAPTCGGNAGAGGFYTYSLSFDLTGLDPTTAAIAGVFGTDNNGSIDLNGMIGGTTTFAGFGAQTSFSFTSGFVAGLNMIDVLVNNGGDPTAFFVQFNTATAGGPSTSVPEPATLSLLGLGLAGIAFGRRKRKS